MLPSPSHGTIACSLSPRWSCGPLDKGPCHVDDCTGHIACVVFSPLRLPLGTQPWWHLLWEAEPVPQPLFFLPLWWHEGDSPKVSVQTAAELSPLLSRHCLDT